MKRFINKISLILGFTFLLTSCNYLDVVPDRTQELDLLFNRQDQAFRALATCFSYLPNDDDLYASYVLATDELATPLRQVTDGIELMRGKQSPNNPLLSLWHGHHSQPSLFRAIYDCNIFIDNIDRVPDMTEAEKDMWKAEVKFLKAYYHFLLLRNHGPIPIMDKNTPISAGVEDLRMSRNTVDECFDFVVNTIDEAIVDLPLRVTSDLNLGRIDQTIASGIKARVLLYAASPLFNGNSEFYSDFTNKDGTVLFNLSYDETKWEKAALAAKEAIEIAEIAGVKMYQYNLPYPSYDLRDQSEEEIQSMYNYRYMFTDKWNSELIWGHSDPVTEWFQIQASSLMKNPDASSNEAAWQWLSPTMRMVESYYTKNGLPISEDLSFDYNNRFSYTTIPDENILEGQAGEETAMLHLNREARFYASIGFDRGFNRAHDNKFSVKMRWNEKPGGRNGSSNDYLITGYILKKFSHPSSSGTSYDQLITYAWPKIRLAELYLIFAEAQNEFNGPSQEVYSALNIIRSRAGVPNIEDAWSNPTFARTLNKHADKDGLREIIKQERTIEMAFEGHRYQDVRRWKEADDYFNRPIKGWDVNSPTVEDFYKIKDVSVRSFITPRDYLQPISLDELTKNPNLVQNPGW